MFGIIADTEQLWVLVLYPASRFLDEIFTAPFWGFHSRPGLPPFMGGEKKWKISTTITMVYGIYNYSYWGL